MPRLAIVDKDEARMALKIREAFDSVRSNIRTFVQVTTIDPWAKQAVDDVRKRQMEGAVLTRHSFRGAS